MNSAEQIELRLHQLQAEQALILDQVDEAIALFDAAGRLVLFNQKLVQLWELSPTHLQHQPPLEDLLDQIEQQGYWTSQQRAEFQHSYQHSSIGSGAFRVLQQDGVYLEIYSTLTSQGGRLFTFRDLTSQKKAQETLNREVRRLTFLLGLTERLQGSDSLKEIGQFSLSYLVHNMGASFGDVKVIRGFGKQRHASPLTNLVSSQFIATHGVPAIADMEEALQRGIPYGQGLLWEVIETGQPLFVENYASHPNAVKAFRHPGIGQLGIFPIPAADGTIIGVLTLESRNLHKLQEAPQQDMLLAACRTLGAAIEQMQAQERLQQINRDLERASRLKSEFLASMSHELRTPLNSILGFAELMLRQHNGELNARQISHVQAIERSGEHLLHLINDILDLSKVEAGKVELEIQTVSLASLCQECLDMIQPRAKRKRLALALELDYQIDQVAIDKRRVQQMIINLLSNAVKFTPEKGRIKLSSRLAYGNQLLQEMRPDESPINPSTPYLCIEVADTGIGIATSKLHLLFQPFQQVDASLTRRHEGTGLGLALTKRLAELHGGTVSFASTTGVGSSFRIWLPLNELRQELNLAHSNATLPIHRPRLLDEHSLESGGIRILVVEDQPYNQALISEVLELESYAVELICDGRVMEATIHSELVKPHTLPNLILMDIQLPGVDGFELIRQLKAHPVWQKVPVIAVTAMAMTGDRDRCLAAGADGYVSKPLDFNELLNQVRILIQEHPTAGDS